MKRTRIKNQSKEMAGWLREYAKLKKALDPHECARCGVNGEGWTSDGGSFEPHHPYRRSERWRILCFIPLCPECHEHVEHGSKKAREEGWIVKPAQVDIFGNPKPRQ